MIEISGAKTKTFILNKEVRGGEPRYWLYICEELFSYTDALFACVAYFSTFSCVFSVNSSREDLFWALTQNYSGLDEGEYHSEKDFKVSLGTIDFLC